MRASTPLRTRSAVFIALSFLLCGMFAMLYQNRVVELSALNSIGRRLAESPVYSFLPAWTLKRWAVPISQERNGTVLSNVFELFDPSLGSFLKSVPIVLDSSVDTARAYRSKGYIAVSPDWDHTVGQSRYRAIYEQRGMKSDAPVFTQQFKTDLLIHEFLHILQAHLGIDSLACYHAVARWYPDQRYGVPSPNGIATAGMTADSRPVALPTNRTKYILWVELYNYLNLSAVPQDPSWKTMHYDDRYRSADKGVEEFAYIGQEILSMGSASEHYRQTGQWSDQDWKSKQMRLFELSPEIVALYRGIFNPRLMH